MIAKILTLALLLDYVLVDQVAFNLNLLNEIREHVLIAFIVLYV